MHAQDIKELIAQKLPDAQIQVSGEDGQHFEAIIIAADFRGKSRIQQQQMVYAALGSSITDGKIHALALKTYTPEEFQQGN